MSFFTITENFWGTKAREKSAVVRRQQKEQRELEQEQKDARAQQEEDERGQYKQDALQHNKDDQITPDGESNPE